MDTEVNRFRWAREKIKKESLTKAAEGSGLARSLLIDLESDSGKPRDTGYMKIAGLAEHYGVSLDWLSGILPFDQWSIEKDARISAEYTGLNSEAIETLARINKSSKTASSIGVAYKDAHARQIAFNFFISDPLGQVILEELYRYFLSDFSLAYRTPVQCDIESGGAEENEINIDEIKPFPSRDIRFLSLSMPVDSVTGGTDLGLSEEDFSEIMLVRITQTIRRLRRQGQEDLKKEK